MQSRDTIHVTAAEWRWVVLVGGGLVLLAFLPLLWLAATNAAGDEWQFMGFLNNYRDGATYLSKMVQGASGAWMLHFQHTPEDHNGAFIQIIYPLLGHLAQLTGIPSIALFHAARVVASLFMYMAIYQFAAVVWTRLRARRIFFILASIGAGFGWLLSPLTGDTTYPDLTIPEMFPFYSSLMNVHFPLTIACLALLASIMVAVFRPGESQDPSVHNGGLEVGLLSFALSLLYPQALVPFAGALGLFVVVNWLRQRRINMRALRWWLVVVAPAVPVAVYYVALLNHNPAIAEWNSQNVTAAPSPLVLALGLGIPLIIALPGIYRAVRRFEPDGDQFMLIWLLTVIVVMYLPTNVQRRFSAGMMLIIAYFATRSLEDFWFTYVNRRWRARLFAVAVPLMAMSYVLLLVGNLRVTVGPFLERDYAAAFEWLRANTRSDDVVLASPTVSLWIPGWTGARVVYGHPFETLSAESREQAVLAWYSDRSASNCEGVLRNGDYAVQYVIVGPQETELGETGCADTLTEVIRFGSVGIYAP
jgi:hypothetical protein